MKSIPSRIAFVLAASAAAWLPAVDALGFVVDTASCDGDPFVNLDLDITCDGDDAPACGFGDTALIEGTVEAVSSFENHNLTFTACLFGRTYCPAVNQHSAGSLCDDWLVPIDNQACGEEGVYNVTKYELIPQADVPNGFNWMVKIVISIDEEDECEATVEEQTIVAQASSEPKSSRSKASWFAGTRHVSYSMMGALVGTIAGTAYAARKKLICTDDDDYDEENDNPFVEMREVVCSGIEAV